MASGCQRVTCPTPLVSRLSFVGNEPITCSMVARRRSGRNARRQSQGSINLARARESMPARRRVVRLLAQLLSLALALIVPACAELELLAEGTGGGPGPPPSGSLSISFIDVGQGDGVLVQAGGGSYLIDAGRPGEGPNVVGFLRSRGVESLDEIVVSNPDADHIGGFLDVFDAFEVETVYVSGDPN